jgi:hypothetical protein
MQWTRLNVGAVANSGSNTGVNARNFEPSAIEGVKVRLLDGADA